MTTQEGRDVIGKGFGLREIAVKRVRVMPRLPKGLD
jgi:hypothetical protein